MMKKLCALFALLLMTLVGCGGSEEGSGGTQTESGESEARASYRLAVIPKGTTHEFWKSVHAGAQNAADELADEGIEVEILWEGPQNEGDRDGQITVVQNFITKQVDGICLAPLDSQSLVGPVNEAKAADIPVVIFDSGLDKEENIVSYVATDNYNGGALAARRLAEAMGNKGNAILLRYTTGSESTEQREDGFLETLEKEFPDINVISSDQYAETTQESSLNVAMQVLGKFKDDVDGIFAVCEPNAVGSLRALEENQLAGKVKFVAFDPSESLIDGMTKKTCDGIVLQDPVTMGYEAVMAMVKHLEGDEVEKRIVTGEYVATPDNMASDEMKTLLEPEQYD